MANTENAYKSTSERLRKVLSTGKLSEFNKQDYGTEIGSEQEYLDKYDTRTGRTTRIYKKPVKGQSLNYQKKDGNEYSDGNYTDKEGNKFNGNFTDDKESKGFKPKDGIMTKRDGSVQRYQNGKITESTSSDGRITTDHSYESDDQGKEFEKRQVRGSQNYKKAKKFNEKTGEIDGEGEMKDGGKTYKGTFSKDGSFEGTIEDADGSVMKGKFKKSFLTGNQYKPETITKTYKGGHSEETNTDSLGNTTTTYKDSNGKIYRKETKDIFGNTTDLREGEFNENGDLIRGRRQKGIGSINGIESGEFSEEDGNLKTGMKIDSFRNTKYIGEDGKHSTDDALRKLKTSQQTYNDLYKENPVENTSNSFKEDPLNFGKDGGVERKAGKYTSDFDNLKSAFKTGKFSEIGKQEYAKELGSGQEYVDKLDERTGTITRMYKKPVKGQSLNYRRYQINKDDSKMYDGNYTDKEGNKFNGLFTEDDKGGLKPFQGTMTKRDGTVEKHERFQDGKTRITESTSSDGRIKTLHTYETDDAGKEIQTRQIQGSGNYKKAEKFNDKGEIDGEGEMLDGGKTYKGEFKDDGKLFSKKTFKGTITHQDGTIEEGDFEKDFFTGKYRPTNTENYTKTFPPTEEGDGIAKESGNFYDRLKGFSKNIGKSFDRALGKDRAGVLKETGKRGFLGNLKEGTRLYENGTSEEGEFGLDGELKNGTRIDEAGGTQEVSTNELGDRKTVFKDNEGKIYKTETKDITGKTIATTEGEHYDNGNLKNGVKTSKEIPGSTITDTGDFDEDENLVNGRSTDKSILGESTYDRVNYETRNAPGFKKSSGEEKSTVDDIVKQNTEKANQSKQKTQELEEKKKASLEKVKKSKAEAKPTDNTKPTDVEATEAKPTVKTKPIEPGIGESDADNMNISDFEKSRQAPSGPAVSDSIANFEKDINGSGDDLLPKSEGISNTTNTGSSFDNVVDEESDAIKDLHS